MSRHDSRFDIAGWVPLAFVVVSLVLLFSVPLVVDWRTRALHSAVDDLNRARILVNDLEAAGATQALIAARPARLELPGDTVSASLGPTAGRVAAQDEAQLDSLFRNASQEERADLNTVRSIERAWRGARAGDGQRVASSVGTADDPLLLMSAAERLDSVLVVRFDSLRTESRTLQQMNIVSALVLTPIAMLSVLVVFIGGMRSRNLARRLAEERRALAESMESRAALVRGITHDVKNPLGAAMGYADLLLDGVGSDPPTPAQATMISRIRKLLHESTATISSLVDLARVDTAEELRVNAHPVDVIALSREVVEDYRAAARERGLTIQVDAPSAANVVITDAGHVRHILGNLVSNAVKYTPDKGRIRVHIADAQGQRVRIAVCDSGHGIAPAMRDRVFEEFVRLDTRAADGHGVGLAISRRLARLLGGELTLGDAPEGGAMFVLELPVKVSAVAA